MSFWLFRAEGYLGLIKLRLEYFAVLNPKLLATSWWVCKLFPPIAPE